MLSLQSLLFGLSVLVSLLLEDSLLVLKTILSLVEAYLDGDQVSLHAVDHMLVGALHHHLVLVGVLDPIQVVLGLCKPARLLKDRVFNRVLLVFGLLEIPLHIT